MFPVKTMLAVASFAALTVLPQCVSPQWVSPEWARRLKSWTIFDAAGIPKVWDMPVAEPPELKIKLLSTAELQRQRDEAVAPAYLAPGKSHELDHFYDALGQGGTIRVLHYGDSPTTADLITADARALLQKQFGDAGHGFVLVAKPWAWYQHRGLKMEASDWQIEVAGVSELKDGLYGLGGARFRGAAGAQASWTFKSSQHTSVEVAYLAEPEGGIFEFEAGGEVIGNADTTSLEVGPAFATFRIPAGATEFTLRVVSGTVELFGAEFRKDRPGIIYSSLGINGANITLLSKVYNNAHLAAELRHYHPDLIVLAYGTNESGFPDFVEGIWGRELRAAIKRLRAAVPQASILLMSPMDRGQQDESGQIHTIGPLPRLVEIEEQVAKEMDVAFFNTYEAMGGYDTMARWYAAEPRLVGSDYIHPLPAGAKIVGELLYTALRDGYNEYKLRNLGGGSGEAGGSAAVAPAIVSTQP